MTAPIVTIRQATLAYQNQIIFNDLDFELPAGQWVALLGPSGVGKSSLLKLVAGLVSEEAMLTGQVTTTLSTSLANHIAYMAQTDLLLPWLTTLNNVCLGARLRRTNDIRSHQLRATELCEQVGLGHHLNHYPHQLSGGLRQRAALARTLLENKPIILMDEPFSALDAITRLHLQELATTLLAGKTVLFITHDPAEALRLADVIYIMHGRPARLSTIDLPPDEKPRDILNASMAAMQKSILKQLAQNGIHAA